jgi:DNA-binding transcriptional LysR family regulator
MNLASMNVNLLVTLDALLAERSVSGAAQRVGVTQSAMSHTLRQLRELFDDPLLVRAGRRMVLTPRAQELEPRLRQGLAVLEGVVGRQGDFDPARYTGRFTLATQDGVTSMLGGPLVRRIRRQAPRAELSIVPVPDDVVDALESGRIDIATAPPIDVPAGLRKTDVGVTTTWSVICSSSHPVRDLDLDAYCTYPHAMMSLSGTGPSFVDHLLARLGRERRVAVRVPYLLTLPAVLEGTDLIATVVTPAADHFAATAPIRAFDCPIEIPGAPMVLLWHARFEADPAHLWFRTAARDAMIEGSGGEA